MSTHNIYFGGEIRKICILIPLSRAMYSKTLSLGNEEVFFFFLSVSTSRLIYAVKRLLRVVNKLKIMVRKTKKNL